LVDHNNEKYSKTTSKFLALLLLSRPKQWTKNLLLFSGLIFSYSFTSIHLVYAAILAFISFCLLSSSAYIINDILDVKEDRLHPRKNKRPIASGAVSPKLAATISVALLLISLLIAWQINLMFFLSSILYYFLTVSYSIWLKHIVIIDVFAIAFGFFIRALAGTFAVEVSISPWFLICTLLLSLFLALTKRRQELISLAENGTNHRKVLEHYPLPFIEQLISIVTSSTIIAYSLYTFTDNHESQLFMITIPFVVYGIFRYLYLVYKQDLGESPEEVLLKDKPMIINILLWVLISITIVAFEHGALR
jgi:4-hydroxybenzoate polyprenyltransferase